MLNINKLFQQIKLIKFIMIVGIIVLVDQYTKYLVSVNIPKYNYNVLIPNFLNIVHIYNPGGAFGFMSQGSSIVRNFLFIGISSIITIIMIFFYKSLPLNTYKFFSFGLLLVIGGSIGNMVDRLRFGSVIDFFDFFLYSYHWPAFNCADISITSGITIIILHILLKKSPI